MLLDLETRGDLQTGSADVCIIGAGAAGIAMALELSRLGLSVLVLEAGGLHPDEATQNLYRSEVSGLPHGGIHDGRVRAFGGTTTKWGGQILELQELDFQRRSWVPGSGWPIAKRDLAAGYARAREIEGVATSILQDEDVWAGAGDAPPPLGPDLETFFTRWCPQPDFAKLYGSALAASPAITVCLHANVCGFVLSASRETVVGVRCSTMSGRKFEFTSPYFVICAGAIETARLLLQPLPDGKAAPWNASGMVGQYFQDHLDVPVGRLIPRNPTQFSRWVDNIYLRGFRYVPKIRASAHFQQEFGTLAIGGSYQFRSIRRNALEVQNMLNRFRRGNIAMNKDQWRSAMYGSDVLVRKAWRFYRHNRAYNPDDLGIDLFAHCEQAPDANSRITLSDSRDALGMFQSRLNWRIGEMELHSARKFAELARREFENAGIARVEVYSETLRDLDTFASKASDCYHHMGTARMSASPRDGVVDTHCKLHGTANAFVCSSAVFPTSGFSNPTHTILALAVRLAAHLAQLQRSVSYGRSPSPVVVEDTP